MALQWSYCLLGNTVRGRRYRVPWGLLLCLVQQTAPVWSFIRYPPPSPKSHLWDWSRSIHDYGFLVLWFFKYTGLEIRCPQKCTVLVSWLLLPIIGSENQMTMKMMTILDDNEDESQSLQCWLVRRTVTRIRRFLLMSVCIIFIVCHYVHITCVNIHVYI